MRDIVCQVKEDLFLLEYFVTYMIYSDKRHINIWNYTILHRGDDTYPELDTVSEYNIRKWQKQIQKRTQKFYDK